MACGTPVIASKVGGLTSFIQDEVNGFLVPEGDEKSLAEKIITLLTNASLKETLGLLARRKAEAFSWSRIAYQMTTLYHFLLKKKGDDTEEIVTIPFPLPERQHALLTP
jgi:glycosyltransferase involved in cell wall biosynthesis